MTHRPERTAGVPSRPPGFATLVAATLLTTLGLGIVAPVLAEAAERYELSGSAAALLLSSFAAGRLIFTWPSGRVADRFDFGRIALVSSGTVVLCAALSAALPPFPVLLVAQLLQGMASTLLTTGAFNHLLHIVDERHVGRMLAQFQGLIVAVYSFAPLIGGVAGAVWGVGGPFLVSAIGGALGFALVAAHRGDLHAPDLPAPDLRPPTRRPSLRTMITSKPIVIALIVGFGGRWMLGSLQQTLLPLHGVEELGFSLTTIGLLMTGGGLAMIVSLPAAGRWIDHRGRRPTVRIGMVAIAVVGLGYAAIVGLPTAVLFVTIGGLARGLVTPPPMVIAADVAHRGDQGSMVGFVRLGPELGGVLGPVMAGALLDATGYLAACLASVVFLGVLAAATWSVPETRRPAGPDKTVV